mgnify:CR=1 FL=1
MVEDLAEDLAKVYQDHTQASSSTKRLIFKMAMQNLTLKVPFEDAKTATIVWNSLRVDPEPKRSGMTKTLRVEGSDFTTCQNSIRFYVGVKSF